MVQRTPPSSPTTSEVSVVDSLRAARELHERTRESLLNFNALLTRRAISLNENTLDLLDQISIEIEALAAVLRADNTELNQLRTLIDTSAIIATSFDLDDILSRSMDEIVRLTGAERGYILLIDPASRAIDIRIARDSTSGGEGISNTVIDRVLTTRQPMVTDNASSDPRMIGTETVARFTLRSIICVPLLYRDQVTGAIYVDNRLRESVFTDTEMNLLQAFANQTAVAIENARLFADVQATLAEITRVKELLENVFASIISGVITTGGEDRILTANRAAAHILALPRDRLLGQPVRALYPRLGDLDDALSSVRVTGQPRILETHTHIDGRGEVTLNLRISPLRGAQVTQGTAMVLDDLTEARAREKTLETLRRYLPPGMIDRIEQIARLDLGGERREVTCMFVYVHPYQIVSDDQPETLMAMLNQFLEATTDVVHHGGGIIDKYMGNEVMVLVNSQLNPVPEHALRAVEMAIALQDAYHSIYTALGIPPDECAYRIGIHTGIATLGNVGSAARRSFTALGDCINLTKRLQETAPPGNIIISQDTLDHILRHASRSQLADLRFNERDAVQVRGRRQPTRIYEVIRNADPS
jgi:PAS domain S-box-containing protein